MISFEFAKINDSIHAFLTNEEYLKISYKSITTKINFKYYCIYINNGYYEKNCTKIEIFWIIPQRLIDHFDILLVRSLKS